MSSWSRPYVSAAIVAILMFMVQSQTTVAAQGAGSGKIAMREKVYKKLSTAQKFAEAQNYPRAFDALKSIEKMRRLQPYEKAQLYTAYGYIYFSQENYVESIGAYEKVLMQEGLPPVLQGTTVYTLAQLQFQVENHARAAEYLEQWLTTALNPGPQPFTLLGQAYYQLKRYQDAATSVERAITIAKQRNLKVKENWLLLLRVFYFELKDYPKLLEVLELLVTQFPNKEYWLHLAAAFGEMQDPNRQLAAYELAYQQGYLDGNRELLLLGQLLLQADVPYRAGVILAQGIESGVIEATVDNYRLLSQAWLLAHEEARAIEILTIAADLAQDGELDARLAQSYANLDDWEHTVEKARLALRKGVEDAHELQIMLGMALFELDRYEEAKSAFRIAQKTPEARKAASRWISYVDREQSRLQELQAATP